MQFKRFSPYKLYVLRAYTVYSLFETNRSCSVVITDNNNHNNKSSISARFLLNVSLGCSGGGDDQGQSGENSLSSAILQLMSRDVPPPPFLVQRSPPFTVASSWQLLWCAQSQEHFTCK